MVHPSGLFSSLRWCHLQSLSSALFHLHKLTINVEITMSGQSCDTTDPKYFEL